MLKLTIHSTLAGLAGVLLAATSACGTQTVDGTNSEATDNSASTAAQLQVAGSIDDFGSCAEAAKDPEVLGDSAAATLVRRSETSVGNLDHWLAQRARDGAPVASLRSYQGLTDLPATAPMTVCVFQIDPRPIPLPSEVNTTANGIRVFVQGPGVHAVDAIGDVERLSKQLDTLSLLTN